MKIQKFIGISEQDYQVLLLNTLVLCLQNVTNSKPKLQLLITNQSIINWFVTEVKSLNNTYLQSTKPFENIDKKSLANNYKGYLMQLGNNYPSALIKKINLNNLE